MSFNDVMDVMEHSGIAKYAEDTILYVAGKNVAIKISREAIAQMLPKHSKVEIG